MGGLSPPAKNRNRNRFVFLSFGVDPLNWQSFIEIGEIACSTTARCSRGHATNLLRDSCGLCHATIGKKEIYFFKMQISPMRNIIRRRTNHNRKDLSLEYFCRQNPSWPQRKIRDHVPLKYVTFYDNFCNYWSKTDEYSLNFNL